MNKIYGFEGEVRSKLNETFVELFAEVFCSLPLAYVLNEKVFVAHGGLFSVDGVKLSDIRAIDRFCEPPEEGKMHNLSSLANLSLPGYLKFNAYKTVLEAVVSWECLGGVAFLFLLFIGFFCV